MNLAKILNLINRKTFLTSPFYLLLMVAFIAITVNLLYFSTWSYGHTLYISGVASFLVAYAYVILIFKPRIGRIAINLHLPLNFNHKVLKIYSYIGVVGAAIAVFIIFSRGFNGVQGLFFNLRYAHIYEQQSSYGASHFALFSLVVTGVNFLNGNNKKAFIFFILYLIPSLASAERTSILYGFSFMLYLSISAQKIKIKNILLSILALILIFVLIAMSSSKLYIDGGFFLLPYLGYGLTAFDDWVLGKNVPGCTALVLGSFGKILDTFSNKASCAEIELAPDGLFNVYTYIADPYLWGGATGLVIIMAALGFIYAALKIKERNSIYFLLVNSCLIFPILMTFYAWSFSLTSNIYMAIILMPVFLRYKSNEISFIKLIN